MYAFINSSYYLSTSIHLNSWHIILILPYGTSLVLFVMELHYVVQTGLEVALYLPRFPLSYKVSKHA